MYSKIKKIQEITIVWLALRYQQARLLHPQQTYLVSQEKICLKWTPRVLNMNDF